MKRRLMIIILFFIFFSSFVGISKAQMGTYCAIPPFISLGSGIRPNVLFDIDVSGSMSWAAYYATWTHTYETQSYDSTRTYEGYFIPDKIYKKINGIWEETNEPDSCELSYHSVYYGWGGIYNYYNWFTINGVCRGNKLNFVLMTRIDLLRWAITGGSPASCYDYNAYFNANYCDPELWDSPGNENGNKVGTVCNNNIEISDNGSKGGCILRTYLGEEVAVPWNRVWSGLAFQFENLSTKPRMGVMFFSGYGVRDKKVYIGDFTAPNSTSIDYPYMNFITYLNSEEPEGATPTAPSLWDAYNYFAQNQPEYGGFTPQQGNGDEWRNPMYVCEDSGGNNCVYVPCAKNFIVLMSDGQWNVGGPPGIVRGACSIDVGFESHSADPVVPAYWLHEKGFTNSKTGAKSRIDSIYTIGLFLGGTGEEAMKNIALYGSFDLNHSQWPDNLTGYPLERCGPIDDCCNWKNCGKGSACARMPPSSPDWDKNGDGIPDTFENASTATKIKNAIKKAVLAILKKTSSGTAASVVSTSEEHGANILQALFWPKRYFDNNTSINWSGTLYNLWMYMGPFSSSQEIRENSDTEEETISVKNLTLKDKVIQFYTDNSTGETKITVCNDLNGSGKLTDCDNESLSYLRTIWDAGKQLWETPPSERRIFTDVDNLTDNATEGNFISSNASVLMSYLDVDNLTLAQQIIKWTRGFHIDGLRDRVVTIGTQSHVWKLGDIIDSTPQILSINPVGTYYEDYKDESYYEFNFNDNGTFRHKSRGVVFVGANDGMLHAFRLGALSFPGGNIIAQLKENGGPFGSEAWAFIPKNILPYLKYMSDNNYCHIYSVDLTPYLFDASIGDPDDADIYGSPGDDKKELSWRTILIGGFNLGGGCGDNATGAIKPPNDTGNVPPGIGRSSYFALDVTNPEEPKVLWEFSDKDLAFTTTGPAIIHIPYKKTLDNGTEVDDTSKNGYWYVTFASGPDKYDGTVHQPLYLYILDLKTGELKRKIQLSGTVCMVGNSDCFKDLIGGYNAFAGRMFSSVIDLGENYSDDAFYFGYNYDTQNGWKGGIIRVNTLDDPNVSNWEVSQLIKGIGPVTAAVRELEDRKNDNLWVYFGEGRYFTKNDDPSSVRNIYGVKDPCYGSGQLIKGCRTTLTISVLDNVTNEGNADVSEYNGWFITLVHSGSGYNAERLITDPIASSNGWVFFTTFMPTGDLCGFGGKTYPWTVKYNNGGTVSDISGKMFLQTSTGAINEINLSKSFGRNIPGTFQGRRGENGFFGAPPKSGGMTVIVPPKPLAKTIQWLED